MVQALSARIAERESAAIDTWMKSLLGDMLHLQSYDLANPLHQKWIRDWMLVKGVTLEVQRDSMAMGSTYRLYRETKLLGELKVNIVIT